MKDVKEVLFSKEAIAARVQEMGKAIAEDYDENLIMVCILKGSVIFYADLVRALGQDCTFEFMEVSSYVGTESQETFKISKDLNIDVAGRDVVIVEDIVDTGNTLSMLVDYLKARKVNSVEIATLLSKPSRRTKDVDCKYVGFEIPDAFVIGYGMDYNQKYRGLDCIGIIDEAAI
ncbi:hypoxanthine phosphoribosyltransferase [Peptoniphilus equinus]|uniref:Hypoxanthine phosphoribosyltransferase n=1 Tax=Peptoniphilus equinus TaxID=3016343 RepID=A0ABY7QSQ3_9FIRM|nr:hypoxanthine phosphoribosyltransferase [Peptoniphilus equinus]WBW49496.1 hypoxanthine phosphoribosyltransferase [Peptoniphilus equinus]